MNHPAITRDQWNAHHRQHVKALRNEHPSWTEDKIRDEAVAATTTLHGPQPENWRTQCQTWLSRARLPSKR